MTIGKRYQFEHCECLGRSQRFNLVIPSGTWAVDEANTCVRVILGYRFKELDKVAFEQLKAERKVVPV
jgi:hypothetical protein